MNIKVRCINCDWEGKAAVGQKISRYTHEQGYKLSQYCCPKCGHGIKKGKGRYDYHAGVAQLIDGKQRWNIYSEKAKLKGDKK